MPFYEYQCKSCGHELEAMQKVSDAPLKKCPHCGKSQLQRLMSAPVFRLKGAGWYETDFKGDKENQRNLADRPEAADASKDAKDAGATAKDGNGKDASGKDANGKDGKPDAKGTETKGTETKSPDTAAAKESTAAKDKPTGKPEKSAGADRPPAAGAGKNAAGKGTSAASRSSAKRPARKPAAKASRRR
jgi:putative FmdB family regulatory protein